MTESSTARKLHNTIGHHHLAQGWFLGGAVGCDLRGEGGKEKGKKRGKERKKREKEKKGGKSRGWLLEKYNTQSSRDHGILDPGKANMIYIYTFLSTEE